MGKEEESIAIQLSKFEGKLTTLMEINTLEHKHMIEDIANLINQVNHEHEAYEERLKILENAKLADVSMYKGRMQLYKWIAIFLGFLTSIFTILKCIRVI
jgi:uncharacterized protein YPO0396